MKTVNMLEAKSSLSRLVAAVEEGHEREIVIARNGRPVARLVPFQASMPQRRLGVAAGKFIVPDEIDQSNADIARLFAGETPT